MLGRWRAWCQDEAISSILGFIVAMVMLTASMAAVTYFLIRQPDPAQQEATRQLQSAATRAADLLVTSPGQPTDWYDNPSNLQRMGLLISSDTAKGDLDKVQAIEAGDISHDQIVDGLDLAGAGMRVHVTGEIKSNPLLKPPSQPTYGIAHATFTDPSTVSFDAESVANLTALCDVNSQCPQTPHHWTWGEDQAPSTGLGDYHADDPWAIHTQLIPQLAGLRATYVQSPVLSSQIPSDSAEEDAYDVIAGGQDQYPHWRILRPSPACDLPGNGLANGDHVLLLGMRREHASKLCNPSSVQWQVEKGWRAWALLGPYDVSEASELSLEMNQIVSRPRASGCTSSDACYAPRIMFWNASAGTSGQWNNITTSSGPGCTSGWDDMGMSDDSSWAGTTTVDLCQALRDSLGEVWLSLYWDSWCENSGAEVACPTTGTTEERGFWAVDDLYVNATVDGRTKVLDQLDHEPNPTTDVLLALGSGVNLDLHNTYDQLWDDNKGNYFQVPALEWPRMLVQNGSSVLAMAPGTDGDWLGGVGLEPASNGGASSGRELLSDHGISRMPNDLNATSDGYVPDTLVWEDGATTGPNGSAPASQLTVVHNITGGTEATVISGQPYTDGGTVTALGYNMGTLENQDKEAYDELLMNAYASTVFSDPTFEMQDSSVPKDAGIPIATARRIVLVTVTEDDLYSVPVELTLYLWEQPSG